MKIACNYYPEVIELIKDNKIDIDYIKFPALTYQMEVFEDLTLKRFTDLMRNINDYRPVLLHGLNPTFHNITSKDFIKKVDLDVVKEVLEISNSPGISLHLAGIDDTLSRKEIIDIVCSNVKYLKENIDGIEFISLENVPNYRQYGMCVYADFISEVIYKSGADFLLDISHAYTAAIDLNKDIDLYINALPLDKVIEIHINGWITNKNGTMCHTKINEHGYRILENVLTKCRPQYLTIEYGRNNDKINAGIPLVTPEKINPEVKDEIIEQVNRINAIVQLTR